MAGKIYVSRVTGLADYEGGQIQLIAGVTRVREGHPILEGRSSVFEEIKVHYDIEDARSAPQDQPVPQPVTASTATASTAQGEAAPLQPEVRTDDPPAKAAPVPRRGPRKQAGS